MDEKAKTPNKSPFQTITSSWWLYFTGRTLFTLCFAAGILIVFLGMALGWDLLPTFAWSGGLIVFSLLSYVVFRAFGDVVARLTDIHNLLERQYNKEYQSEE